MPRTPRRGKVRGFLYYPDKIEPWLAKRKEKAELKKNTSPDESKRVQRLRGDKLEREIALLDETLHDSVECEAKRVRQWTEVRRYIEKQPSKLASRLSAVLGADARQIQKFLDVELVEEFCAHFSGK